MPERLVRESRSATALSASHIHRIRLDRAGKLVPAPRGSAIGVGWVLDSPSGDSGGLDPAAGVSMGMSSRGRHQTTSKECARLRRRIEALEGVRAVVIGRSYGGKSLGRGEATGSLRVQREMPAGVKAVTQTEKGVQEWMILTERAPETIAAVMAGLREIEAER